MENYKLYVDGGGTAEVENYFSFKIFDNYGNEAHHVNRELVSYYQENKWLPENCSIHTDQGNGSNNIAELCSLYVGIKFFSNSFLYPLNRDTTKLTIYHDSQICYRWVMTALDKQDELKQKGILHAECRKPWLKPWVNEIVKLWQPNYTYIWVNRDIIVSILGH
jgi:hypothetical protein